MHSPRRSFIDLAAHGLEGRLMDGNDYAYAYGALSEYVRLFLSGDLDADELRRGSERVEFELITKTKG